MSNLVPFHGAAMTSGGRLDIRAMMKHYLVPYKAAEPYRGLIETVRSHSPSLRRGRSERLAGARAISDAVFAQRAAVFETLNKLNIALMAPDEADVRLILGAMLTAFPSRPTDDAGVYVDALVGELREPDGPDPYSLPAIAAAAKETWKTFTMPPSIADFLPPIRRHQRRIEMVQSDLASLLVANDSAEQVLKALAPELVPAAIDDF